MKHSFALVLVLTVASCSGPVTTKEEKQQIIDLSNEVASLSEANQAMLIDLPTQQSAADTLMLFYQKTQHRYTKVILLNQANILQADIEKKKSDIAANSMKIHQDKLALKRITTGDQLIALSDSATAAAIAREDTTIKLIASDSTVKQ